MKALRWHAKGDVRVENIPEPELLPGNVKINIKWCGICGSDLHEYLAGPIGIPTSDPHPLTGKVAPVTLGHELSGQIVELGEGVTKFKIGDRVTVEPIVVCGKCSACIEGHYNMCETIGWFGNCGVGGGFAEYTVFPEDFVHKLDEKISYEKGALIEPLTVGLHSVRISGFKVGQNAIVSGAGPIGLGVIESLKAAGASKIIVVQRKSVRQQYALNMGADVIVDPNECDAVAEIKRLTNGGADMAFETTGSEQCINIDVGAVRHMGKVVVLSIWEKKASISLNPLVYAEKTITGSIVYQRYEFPSTISLMAAGKIKADGYITKKIYLDDIVEEGFKVLCGPKKKEQVKILVTPDKSLL